LRIAFYSLIFYRNIYVSGYFYRIIYTFYSIIYVSGELSANFPEIFITSSGAIGVSSAAVAVVQQP
jgi:hypothetical protein